MKAKSIESLCALCMISALLGQLFEGSRYWKPLRMVVAFRVLLALVEIIRSII